MSWESEKDGFGYMVSGPYVSIKEGSYNLSFRIKISDNSMGDHRKVVTIEISKNKGSAVVARDLHASEFKENDSYRDFTINFEIRRPITDAEFRVHYDRAPLKVNIDTITLARDDEA